LKSEAVKEANLKLAEEIKNKKQLSLALDKESTKPKKSIATDTEQSL